MAFLTSRLSATALIGLLEGFKFLITILSLSFTIFPFHLLGLKGLIGAIDNFLEFIWSGFLGTIFILIYLSFTNEWKNSIKYYLGTWFGKGNNIYSWIHEDDLVNSILFLVKNKKSGIYNLVAPNPVSSKLFTIEISKILNKKLFFPPIPKKIIKLFTGSMSELLLFSQDVSSNKLKSEGFEFKFNKLSPALRDLLK